MRLLITGGGTGGHVYPALSVLEAWNPPPTLLWVGKQGGMEAEILRRAGLPYQGIRAGGLNSTRWNRRLLHSLMLVQGFGEAWQILRRFKPDVVFATGGYVTGPVGLAARLQRVPIVIYLPDIRPGLAVKALAPLATRVAVTTPRSADFFGDKAVVTGYPVRKALTEPRSRAAARGTFGINEADRLLLVMGGSSGAHNLNVAIGENLARLLPLTRIIHLYGKSDEAWLMAQKAALPDELRDRYQPFSYLHDEMADALLAADLIVARAGASVLGELPAAKLPAVLVPLPIAGVGQDENAAWLVERGGAAQLDDDAALPTTLPALLATLLNDEATLQRMAAAMAAAAPPNAAARIVALLQQCATANANNGQPRKSEVAP